MMFNPDTNTIKFVSHKGVEFDLRVRHVLFGNRLWAGTDVLFDEHSKRFSERFGIVSNKYVFAISKGGFRLTTPALLEVLGANIDIIEMAGTDVLEVAKHGTEEYQKLMQISFLDTISAMDTDFAKRLVNSKHDLLHVECVNTDREVFGPLAVANFVSIKLEENSFLTLVSFDG